MICYCRWKYWWHVHRFSVDSLNNSHYLRSSVGPRDPNLSELEFQFLLLDLADPIVLTAGFPFGDFWLELAACWLYYCYDTPADVDSWAELPASCGAEFADFFLPFRGIDSVFDRGEFFTAVCTFSG